MLFGDLVSEPHLSSPQLAQCAYEINLASEARPKREALLGFHPSPACPATLQYTGSVFQRGLWEEGGILLGALDQGSCWVPCFMILLGALNLDPFGRFGLAKQH